MIPPVALAIKEGLGLFTLEKISQGTTILWLPANQALKEPNQYSIYIKDLDLIIDCRGHQAEYITHSCQPTAVIRGTRIVAWQCLNPGDSITVDYAKNDAKVSQPFICECHGALIV